MSALILLSPLALLFSISNSLKFKGEMDLLFDLAGNAQSSVEVEIDYDDTSLSPAGMVEIKCTYIDDSWNGIGFGSQVMNGTYAIIFELIAEEFGIPFAEEWILGHHNPGQTVARLDNQDNGWIEITDNVFDSSSFVSTITMIRGVEVDSNNAYQFPAQPADGAVIEIPIIAAKGPDQNNPTQPVTFFDGGRHSQFNREAVTLVLEPVSNATTEAPINATEAPREESCCDCLVASNFPRCFNQFGPVVGCENTICSKDEYCCTGRWDELCVQQASAYCEGAPQAQCCACTVGQGGQAGCPADPACEATICAQDPYCCGADNNGFWDKACVNQAYALCSPQ